MLKRTFSSAVKPASYIISSLALIIIIGEASAQSPDWIWGKSMGNTYGAGCSSVALDKEKNVYSTGTFKGTVDFDPGAGVFNLTETSGVDPAAFIVKLDSNGNFSWAKGFSETIYSSEGSSISIDSSDNVYTIGVFQGMVDFDPGIGTFILNSASGNLFISKLDSAGNFIWAKQISGSLGGGRSLALDASGNIYISGEFRGTGDFDPGAGVFNLSSVSTSYSDIFICKLNSAGNFLWAESIGGSNESKPYSVYTDEAANIYFTGSFMGTVDFDPGTGIDTLSAAPGRGIFACKLDSSGNLVWAKGMTGGAGEGRSVGADAKGNVYITGDFYQTMDFDPGPGIHNLSTSNFDIFIAKLDSSGNYISAKNIGGIYNDGGTSLRVDSTSSVFITGWFSGTVAFNPDSGNHFLTSSLYNNLFILKMDSLLNFSWVKAPKGTANSLGSSIALDASGNAYLAGAFGIPSSLIFGVDTLINADGNSDILLVKLDHNVVAQIDSPIVYNFLPFYAGQDTGQQVLYFDYVPDTFLTWTYINNDWHNQDGNLDMDLNQDGTVDFKVKGSSSFSPGHSYTNYYIVCLNGNQVVTSGAYANPLEFGTQIDSCTSWSLNDTTTLSGTFTLNLGGQTTYWGPWNQVIDRYLGVRIFNSTDTLYGYIHINRRNGFLITDYGIHGIYVGINELEKNSSVTIFPNPFSSFAFLKLSSEFKNAKMKIYNSVGSFVREERISNQEIVTLNRKELSSGLYFLELINERGQTITKKFVVE